MATLAEIMKGGLTGGMTRVSDNIAPVTRTLPNGGGTYVAPGPVKKQVFQGATPPPAQPAVNPEYVKPDGTYYTAKEVVANRAAKLGTPSAIPTYVGNAITNPDQTVTEMNRTNAGMTNAANDIATGTTDPYAVASKSGIAYSPAEMKAIEKAYAGIYDPALTDIHTKLKARADLEKAKTDAEIRKAEIVFNTNENIRQWRATTGSKAGTADSTFTPTQLHKGASVAGLEMDSFNTLDNDVKNYFINPPKVDDGTGKLVPMPQYFDDVMKQLENGEVTKEEVLNALKDGDIPAAVKTYYVNHLPVTPEIKQGYFSKIWSAVKGQ